MAEPVTTPPATPAAPAAPEATPVELEQNEFGSEFAKLVEGLKEPGTPPVAATPAAPAAPATPAAEGTPPVTPPAEGTPPATPAAEGTPPATPAAPTVEELQAQLAASQAALEEARKAPAAAAPAAPAAAAPAPAAPAEKPLYTEDEQAVLAQYDKDWEVVSRGEALKRRAEYHQLVKHIFDQVNARYAPLLENVDSLTDRSHKSDLLALVPDYAKVRDQAVTWAQTQTGIHRATYDRVIAEGSPEEVRDLIEEWRTKTGYKAPAATTPPAAAPAAPAGMPPAAANDPAKTAALAALRPVDSQRSVRTEGADPNDFDNSFVEFATAAAR